MQKVGCDVVPQDAYGDIHLDLVFNNGHIQRLRERRDLPCLFEGFISIADIDISTKIHLVLRFPKLHACDFSPRSGDSSRSQSSPVAKLESIFLRYDQKNTGLIGLESFCSIVESLAPWTEKTPVEKRATRTDYEEVVAEVDPMCHGTLNFHQLCAGFAVLTKARKLINYREYLQQEEVVEYRRIFKHTTERKGQSGLTKSDLDKILRRMGATLTKGAGLEEVPRDLARDLRRTGAVEARAIHHRGASAIRLWTEGALAD
eukprot:g7259.t1